MKILGIDSSGQPAGVAVAENGVVLAEYTVNNKKTHSQTLIPMLEEIRNALGLDMSTIDAIALAAGPGSFTGLRIGSGSAKGLAFGLNKPIVEVPTLEGLAMNVASTDRLVCPIMDARRNQVYTGIYEFTEKDHAPVIGRVLEQCAIDINDVIARLNQLGRPVVFLGDGVPVYRAVICEKLQVPFVFAPANNSLQRGASIAALGCVYYEEGRAIPAKDHSPEYLRASQAERESAEKAAQATGGSAEAKTGEV